MPTPLCRKGRLGIKNQFTDIGKTYCVYKHTCLVNNKVYIGITSLSPEKRWGCQGRSYRNNSHFYSAIQKYGWDNFSHDVLYDGLSFEEAAQKEIELIAFFKSNSREFGYNISSGGEPGNGVHCTEERKTKIRAKRLGYKCSEETRKKISEANKRRSPETLQKISESRRGQPTWNKGIVGKDSHSYGVVFSEERRRHISEATRGKPKVGTNKEVIDTQTNIIYRTARDAAKAIGVSPSCVYYQCARQGKYAHRFKFVV